MQNLVGFCRHHKLSMSVTSKLGKKNFSCMHTISLDIIPCQRKNETEFPVQFFSTDLCTMQMDWTLACRLDARNLKKLQRQ